MSPACQSVPTLSADDNETLRGGWGVVMGVKVWDHLCSDSEWLSLVLWTSDHGPGIILMLSDLPTTHKGPVVISGSFCSPSWKTLATSRAIFEAYYWHQVGNHKSISYSLQDRSSSSV